MYFDELVCCPWLRLVEVANEASFEVAVPHWAVGLGNEDFGTNTLTVVECEYCCALLTRNKWIVIHRALLSASIAHESCSTFCCSSICALFALSRSALASAMQT